MNVPFSFDSKDITCTHEYCMQSYVHTWMNSVSYVYSVESWQEWQNGDTPLKYNFYFFCEDRSKLTFFAIEMVPDKSRFEEWWRIEMATNNSQFSKTNLS